MVCQLPDNVLVSCAWCEQLLLAGGTLCSSRVCASWTHRVWCEQLLFALSANIKDGFAHSGSVSDEDAQTPGSGELPNILSKGPPQSGKEEVQRV